MKKIIFVLFISILVVSAGIGYSIAALFQEFNISIPSEDDYITENIPVQFTTTFWTTCEEAAIKYKDPRDVREIMYETEKINGMKPNDFIYLNNNDIIIIPIKHKKSEQPVIGVTNCSKEKDLYENN